jgi:predicted GNAT family N-acyltransferase
VEGDEVQVTQTDAATVRPLRHHVLRFGLPPEESVYPQDDLPETVHLVASDGGQIVGVATVFPEAYEGRAAWRLRGMAVVEASRNRGIGSLLLREVVSLAHGNDVDVLWCNARTAALSFYERHGFTIVGEEFLAAGGVPHRVAVLELKARRV